MGLSELGINRFSNGGCAVRVSCRCAFWCRGSRAWVGRDLGYVYCTVLQKLWAVICQCR